MLFRIAVCNVSRVHIKLLWFSLKHDSAHNKVSNVASKVLNTKQKKITFVMAYSCNFIIIWDFFVLCLYRYHAGFTEHALYFRVRQSQIVKCKFLILEYFYFIRFYVFQNITIAINFNSYFALDVKNVLFTFLTISG